jgi:hypothetical protein
MLCLLLYTKPRKTYVETLIIQFIFMENIVTESNKKSLLSIRDPLLFDHIRDIVLSSGNFEKIEDAETFIQKKFIQLSREPEETAAQIYETLNTAVKSKDEFLETNRFPICAMHFRLLAGFGVFPRLSYYAAHWFYYEMEEDRAAYHDGHPIVKNASTPTDKNDPGLVTPNTLDIIAWLKNGRIFPTISDGSKKTHAKSILLREYMISHGQIDAKEVQQLLEFGKEIETLQRGLPKKELVLEPLIPDGLFSETMNEVAKRLSPQQMSEFLSEEALARAAHLRLVQSTQKGAADTALKK